MTASDSTGGASRRPKVGLVGFYNWGNFGDELFVHVFRQFLEPRFEVLVMPDKTESPFYSQPVSHVVSGVDAIIIGGGELIVPWKYSDFYWNRGYLEKPVFIFGLGASTYNQVPRSMERYRQFFQHPSVQHIHLRDDASRQFVEKNFLPKVPVTHSPDIVFALDLPSTASQCGAPIFGVVTKHNRRGEDDLRLLDELCGNAANAGWRVRKIVLSIGSRAEQDREAAENIQAPGAELCVSESLRDLSSRIGECSVLASMKLHGIIVAARYGVPSISLLREEKISHAMAMLGLQQHISDLADPRLPNRLDPPPEPIAAEVIDRLSRESRNAMIDLADRLDRCIG